MKNRKPKSSIREIVSEEYRKVLSVSLELGEKYTQEQFKTMYEKYLGSEEKTELMKFFEQTVETSAISHGEITEPYQKWIDKLNDDVHTKEFCDDLKQQTDQVKEKQYRITTLDDNFIDARFLAIQADEFSQKMVEELSGAIRDSALVEYNGEMIKVPELLCKLECLGFDTEYKEKLISKSMGETQTALFTQFHGELIKVLTAVYKNGPSGNPTIQKAYKFADYLQRGGTREEPGFSNPKLGFALLGVDYNKDSLTKQTFVTYRLEDASNQIRYIPYKDRIAIRSTIERDEKFNALFTSYNLITRKGNPKDLASLDPQEEIFLWAPLEEEVSQPQDKESYYGFEFDSQRFTQFIEDFKERLDKYNPLNLKQWFEETLEQPEFYEKYEDLAARMSEYSWVSGQASKLSWSQFTDLSNEDAWAWLVKHCCNINENQEIRFMSIFDLLEPYSNLNLHSSYK